MIRRLFAFLSVMAALAMTTGCAVNRASATLVPGADLSKIKSIYVVKASEDERGIDALIKTDLAQRGFKVDGGPAQTPPYKADAVITYVDRWMWDITMYMLELTITVREPSEFPLATGNSFHTSLARLPPPAMVHEVLDNITKAKPQGAAK